MGEILYTADGTPVDDTNPLPVKPVDADGDEKFTDANPAFVKLTAGAALAGKVGIDQTTPGTTNGVQVNAALPAGDNNIGNVDIASAIPAGTNLIGKVGIDQTTPGTTNAVALTGSNAGARETLTIDATVGGIGFTGATISGYTKALVTCETAQVRFTIDGTAPTTTVGHLLNPSDVLELDTAADLAAFKAIRTGATSGSLQCTFSV